MASKLKQTENSDHQRERTIEIRVLYFASARERVGRSEERLYFAKPPTLKELQIDLYERYRSLTELSPYLRWAVDQSFVEDDSQTIDNGSEVALIPPISGG
mgnify:CR=1 FL=1